MACCPSVISIGESLPHNDFGNRLEANAQLNSSQAKMMKKRAEQQQARPTVIQRPAKPPPRRKPVVIAATRQAPSDAKTARLNFITTRLRAGLASSAWRSDRFTRLGPLFSQLTKRAVAPKQIIS